MDPAAHDPVAILIVDDRPENLLSMEALLHNEAISVVKAGSGREALSLTLKQEFALVLLDVQMPEMDGFETAELMRGNPKTRGLPVIFVTAGEKSTQSLFKGYESGAVDYIYKPIDPVILRSKVQVFSELYRQRRAIERHEQHLEQQVAQRTRELSQALELAEASNRVKSEFIANISHEIRTPMTAMQGAIDLLQLGDMNPDQQQYLEMISTASGNLLVLIDNILAISEIEAGRVTLSSQNFSLRACLNEVVATQAARIHEKQLAISIELDETVPNRLCGDPLRLKQIVLNLLGNAVKFTPQGKIIVRVTSPNPDNEPFTLQIAVADTGIGIPRAELGRVFEPFVQADGSMTRRFGGTGLGLAICQRLTRLMGGEIAVESTEGVGSTFSVSLPMEREKRPG